MNYKRYAIVSFLLIFSIILAVILPVLLNNGNTEQNASCSAMNGALTTDTFFYDTEYGKQMNTGAVDYCKLPDGSFGEVYNRVITEVTPDNWWESTTNLNVIVFTNCTTMKGTSYYSRTPGKNGSVRYLCVINNQPVKILL